MPQRKDIPCVLGIAALAMMFCAGTVYAQSSSTTSGKESAGMSSQNQAGQGASSGASTMGQAATSGQGVNSSDRNLMRELAYANLAEVEAAKIAQSQSQNDQVKNFAQRMMDDHTKALQELQQLAQQKGVALPTEPDAQHKAEAKKLAALSGDKFDKRYMAKGGLSDHHNTHRLLSRVQDRASDPDLKALASKMMPVVDQHLSMAQNITGAKSATDMSGSSMGPAGTSGAPSSASGGASSGGTTPSTNTQPSGATGTSGSSNSVGPSK